MPIRAKTATSTRRYLTSAYMLEAWKTGEEPGIQYLIYKAQLTSPEFLPLRIHRIAYKGFFPVIPLSLMESEVINLNTCALGDKLYYQLGSNIDILR